MGKKGHHPQVAIAGIKFPLPWIFFFLAVLGLSCCIRAFSSCLERGLLFAAVRGLFIVVASPVAEHGL